SELGKLTRDRVPIFPYVKRGIDSTESRLQRKYVVDRDALEPDPMTSFYFVIVEGEHLNSRTDNRKFRCAHLEDEFQRKLDLPRCGRRGNDDPCGCIRGEGRRRSELAAFHGIIGTALNRRRRAQ